MGTINIKQIQLPHVGPFLYQQIDALNSTFDFPFTVYSGAVGAGKTILLAHAGIQTCINYPGCTGMACSLTYTQLRNVLFHVLLEELKKYQNILNENHITIKLIKNLTRSTGNMILEFYNGSRIIFLPATAEEDIRGYTLDFFLIDEPIEIDEKVFTQLLARMRGRALIDKGRRTFGILATNPGAETHWIWQRFYGQNHPDYNHIEESYDDDWKRRFLAGKWGAFEGQIYKEFSTDKHVLDMYETREHSTDPLILVDHIKQGIKYYIAGVDYGSRNPGCIAVIGIGKKGIARIVEEWYGPDTSVNMAKRLVQMNKKYNFKKIFIDPSQLDLITQCQQLHLPAEKGDNKVDPGITKMKSLLAKGLLLVDKRCTNIIREFLSYRYARDRMNLNRTEKPLKIDDHSMDAIRYALYTLKIWNSPSRVRWGNLPLWDY